MSVEIIHATAEQLEGILAIECTSFDPPWSAASIQGELDSPDSLFLAAVSDHTVLGFCVLHQTLDEGEIYQIAVAGHFRRQGIANRLLARIIQLAAERGIQTIFLEVRAGNSPATALYNQNGFVCVGCRKNYYDNPKEDAVLMRLDIGGMERRA
jgi:ribosomal-protein-alanine N-acetyltransferase